MNFLQKIILWLKNFIRSSNQQSLNKNPSDSLTTLLNNTEKDAGHINYSANLIPDLKQDHADLLEMYISIHDLVAKHHYQDAVERLTTFKEHFNRHLMQENVKFYAYFDYHFTEQCIEHQTIKSYRKEMNQIAFAVVKFLKKWTISETLDQQTSSDFFLEYQDIASALAQRIADEERELYVLYQVV